VSAGARPALPLEAGRPRVQRLVDELRPVHLEAEVPVRDAWTLSIDGLVDYVVELDLEGLRMLGLEERTVDFHCVWGWSRRGTRWRGVPLDAVLDLAAPRSDARYVTFAAHDSPYASCIPFEDARQGLLALEVAGEPLPPLHGGPLRYVPPAHLWGYKGVKWLGSIVLRRELVPGFWEEKVGDVEGRIPEAILELFDRQPGGAR
jgi:DMSO/TMAO reductase YedYZ molybdopterin-dependent catalytic subunit